MRVLIYESLPVVAEGVDEPTGAARADVPDGEQGGWEVVGDGPE